MAKLAKLAKWSPCLLSWTYDVEDCHGVVKTKRTKKNQKDPNHHTQLYLTHNLSSISVFIPQELHMMPLLADSCTKLSWTTKSLQSSVNKRGKYNIMQSIIHKKYKQCQTNGQTSQCGKVSRQ